MSTLPSTLFVVSENSYEYNDEYYSTPDCSSGQEPGIPKGIFQTKAAADAELWKREVEAWRNGGVGSYVYEIREGELSGAKPGDAYYDRYAKSDAEVREKQRGFAEAVGIADASTVVFGYEFELPDGLTDEQVKKISLLFGGPHFFNVFETNVVDESDPFRK